MRWHFEGQVLSEESVVRALRERGVELGAEGLAEDLANSTGGRLVIERPKALPHSGGGTNAPTPNAPPIRQVIFCPKTRHYVMYFHLDHYQRALPHYHWRRVGVASSPFAVGPFKLRRVLRPDGRPSLDLTLHQAIAH